MLKRNPAEERAPELVAHVCDGVGVLDLKRPDRGRADLGQALSPIDIDECLGDGGGREAGGLTVSRRAPP